MMEYQPSLSFPILSTLFLITVVMIWKKFKNTSYEKLPPGPRKLPIIGNMHHLLGDMIHRRLSDLAKQYGPIMHLQLGELTNIIISSPDAAKHFLKTHDINFSHRPSNVASDILFCNGSDIAFAPYGDSWRQLRKMCTLELLSAKRVESFRHVREEELSKLIGDIQHRTGSPINLSSMLKSLSCSIISRAAFGKAWNGQDAYLPLVDKIAEVIAGFNPADFYPSAKWLHHISGTRRTAGKIHREMDKLIEDIINQHLIKKETGLHGEQDLVDVLLNLQKHEDLQFPLSTNNIKAVILDMFSAGTETSSRALEWTMSELMRNPEIMVKAQAEVRQVFGKNEKVDETRFGELIYLKSVIKETLRLHPPLPLLVPRECGEKREINGYDIPSKSRVFVNAWAIGRDPAYWIEPNKFAPDRFLDGLIDFKGNNFEFIPFGAGRRICPGIMFGMVSIEHTLSQLLYHFDWKLSNGMKAENLDMTELCNIVLQRKTNLMLVPTRYVPI